MRLLKWTSMMLLALIFVLFYGCGRDGAEKENGEELIVIDSAAESADDDITNQQEQAQEEGQKSHGTGFQSERYAALERFGTYLEYLLKEGDRRELEQYVISRTLTWDEAAAIADLSPAFLHFSSYGKGEFRFDSRGAILVEADVNGDGLEDLIEYLPDVGDNNDAPYPFQYSLTIYGNQGDQVYGVMYFQPYFDTEIEYYDQITVLRYDGEIYLVFTKNKDYYKKGQTITVYQMQDCVLTGRIIMDCEYTDMSCEVLCCKSGMEEWTEELCEGAMDYWIADPKEIREQLLVGSAEEILDRDSEEYATLERIGREEAEEYMNRYWELTGGDSFSLYYATVSNAAIACQSDLDNDGELELYAQQDARLGIGSGNSGGINYPTGELYGNGKHELEWGLLYSLEKGGERTCFEQLCGLDIWSSDNIPQAFWVKRCGEENITFFKYYDRNYFACLIEGYYIREGSYEKVLSIRYRPIVSCEPVYEWREYGESEGALSYTIHLLKGKNIRYPYPVLYGLQDQEIQNNINDKLKTLLQERIDSLLARKEGEGNLIWNGARCNVLFATKKKLVLKYIYIYECEGWESGWGEDICVEIDLVNGEVQLSDYWESDYCESNPWKFLEERSYWIVPTW